MIGLIRKWERVMLKGNAKKRVSEAEEKGLCVACMEPLGDGLVISGCHQRCYRATKRAIDAGEFTEAERVSVGKLLPPSTPGRKPSNPVTLEARGLS